MTLLIVPEVPSTPQPDDDLPTIVPVESRAKKSPTPPKSTPSKTKLDTTPAQSVCDPKTRTQGKYKIPNSC